MINNLKPFKWQPPTGWEQHSKTFAPITITKDKMSKSVRQKYGIGGTMLAETPGDTVILYQSMQQEGLTIDQTMAELLLEQLRIAQACGRALDQMDVDERLSYALKIARPSN